MYQSIMELPTQVTASLSDEDAKVWMDAYNEAFKADGASKDAIQKARRKAWRACKDLPSSFSFCITASVEDVDRDREIIDIDTIAKNLDEFISYGGNVNYDHSSYNVGTIWDWEPMEKDGMPGLRVWGNVFGGDKVYDEMRQLFVKGVNSLSVAGAGSKGHFQCDSRGCYVRKGMEQLMEISLCKVPANKHATLQWYNENATLTKSASASEMPTLRMYVDEYTIHRDESTCPILSLAKSLRAIGYNDAQARINGVFIPMSLARFENDALAMRSHDLVPEWNGYGALVNARPNMIEKTFRRGYDEGWVESDGRINDSIPECDFRYLYKLGLICPSDTGYRLIL